MHLLLSFREHSVQWRFTGSSKSFGTVLFLHYNQKAAKKQFRLFPEFILFFASGIVWSNDLETRSQNEIPANHFHQYITLLFFMQYIFSAR